MRKLSHRRILLLLIVTPVLLFMELAVGLAVFTSIRDINTAEKRNNKLDTYLRTNGRYVSLAESAQRGYLLTGDTRFRDTFSVCRDEIGKNEAYYAGLPNDIKNNSVSNIQRLSATKFEEMGQTVRLYDAGLKDSAVSVVKTGIGMMTMDSIRTASTGIRTQITDYISRERDRESHLFVSFFALIAVLILFSVFLVQYTYRKFIRYTRELETLVNSLEDANVRMGAYTAESYHELKTPLRSIHGFAQLLRIRYSNGDPDSEQDQFAQYITDGIKQMNQTIDGLRTKYLHDSLN